MIFIKGKHIAVIVFGLLMICEIGFPLDKKKASNTYHTELSNTIPTTSSIPVTSTRTTTSTTVATTIVSTTTISATTAIESTTATETTAAIAEISDESSDERCLYEEQEIYEEYEDNDTEYLEPSEVDEVDCDTNESYSSWYTAKWYTGSVGTYGYSGRDLISGYSVASPDFPQGTLLQITGGGLDGIYRVDDTGCPSGVIDFFYFYGEVPSHFEYNGVYDIEVCVVE